jgi:hypothetical protein
MSLEEFLARAIAARKMHLLADPNGTLLPEDLWRQALPEAQFLIGAIDAYALRKEVLAYYQDEDEGE